MTFIIVMLWVLVGFRVLSIFLLPHFAGKTIKTEFTPSYIASRSFFNVISIAILALAAIALTNYP